MRIQFIHRASSAREKGVVAIQVALFLVVLLGFAALAVDVSRAFVVRNELQNAADAAALAGAGALNGTLTINSSSTTWTTADAAATVAANAVIARNSANGAALSTAQVQTGYWNVTGSPAGLQSTAIKPGQYDRPAVMVSVSLSKGNNGGPMSLVFAPMLGVKTLPVSATAVAVISSPGTANTGSLFPMVITQCLLNDPNYWNTATGQPVIDPKTGKPIELQIGSSYHYDSCDSGQWTSFNLDANDVPTIDSLIQNGNPTPMNVGDNTWIEPGTKTSIYNHMTDYINLPAQVLLPVVSVITTHATQPILGFVAFQIDQSVGGSGKYVQGHFLGGLKAQGTTGGSTPGPYYGAYTPASLAE
ncbi:pilus assembly protein TadG-related protein [Burkholderia ubonensis]|uniref:Pilus assembly protein TadE n=1 Tax=Burkholderia ubonensis TaxID=101571 RepID=A0AAW3NBL3_9BURK|nr:TadG family pilus assembly protein [Burkholderia ubonensis]KVT54102.1 pilus assembly protein TadE [Burkholderia ubonensis]